MCRAFALEGRGIWHALSLSATQQVYGPLRARADMRVALESPPPSVPAEEAGRATLEGAWQVAPRARPRHPLSRASICSLHLGFS